MTGWPALALLCLLAAAAATAWALSLRRLLDARSGTPETEGADVSGGHDGRDAGSASSRPRDELAEAARAELERVLDSLADAFFHVDAEWRVTFVNESARRLLRRMGRSGEDLLDRSLWDAFFTPPEDEGRVVLEEAMAAREPRTRVSRNEELDAWLEVGAFPSGEGGLSVHVRDVTDREEAEEALRESEERFRTVVKHAPEAIVVLDAETGEVVDFNENALELWDRSAEELRGTAPYQFSPPTQPGGRSSIELAEEYIRRTLDGESPVFEWVHLTGDGRRVHTEVRLVELPSRVGRLIRGSVTDITHRKMAEDALRESEERFRTLFEDDVAGNFVTDVDGKVKACNPAFARMFGFSSKADALGSNVYDLYPSREDREAFLARIRDEESLEYLEVEARRTDGSPLHLIENVRGVFDDEGRLTELRGHLIDVTEKKELAAQLQQAQKLEAVGRLAGGVAHDFNNLLTTISGHADLLLMEEQLPPNAGEDVRKIRRAAKRAASLTNQLLAFSRRQVLEPEVLTLDRVVAAVTEMLARLMGERVDVTIDVGDDLDLVRADAGQLEQVVMNLALNARDAMPDGGELRIAAGNLEVEEELPEEVGGGRIPPAEYSYIEVADSGTGIPEDAREKIFEPFYTTKGPTKGTGLGLAMVYGIVRQSGGYVQVESELDVGSTFRILFPVETEEGELEGPTRGRDEEKGTILVHQEDPVVRKLVRRVLQREGHTVLEAESAPEAAAFIREWSGPVQLVLTDTLAGDEECPRLDRIEPVEGPPPGFLLTLPAKENREGRSDGHPVLRTPFSPRDLVRRVQRVLNGRSLDSSQGADG